MSSQQIRKRLQNVGVEVDLRDVQLDNLSQENFSLKKQLEESQKKEEFLEHELEEAYASLSVERLAVRGLTGRSRVEGGDDGLNSNIMKNLVNLVNTHIFLHRHCRFWVSKLTIWLWWIFSAFMVGVVLNMIFNIFF